ncbi:hypothetical protein BUALT_Bualt03G0214000 [Buddleja alternifolia]|uniref:AB hydrolase-1 domain-containing protein n=1 Tax=Buddleja alternifolia TaxID=168488 RepID=A0AAV6Y6Y3_9LAMI|nr:hypothetical protein BUALT_Bualt03G0214000 [Buddleja alternifolia]
MTNIPTDVPLFLAYGGADALSVSQDVKLLLDSLHDHEGDKLVVEYREDYAHADYVMSVNAKQVVYLAAGGRTKLQRIAESTNEADGICKSTDARTWLDSPDESLGFILADNGFDVWLANVRGTNYSSGHTSLSPDDSEYWNWSWDELVAYDLPATFQYVYDQTGQKLHYVGHSLGTLMAFGAFSRKEVLNMVRSAALLSPIAYLGEMSSDLARAAADAFIAEGLYWLGVHEFSPGGGAASKLVDEICNKIKCTDLESMITVIRQGTIEMYDYGSDDENNKYYGQPTPPEYNMTSIPDDLPLFLSYGGKDFLSDVKDVQTLVDKLVDHEPDKLVLLYKEDYAHLDFVHGYNAKQEVYDPIMNFFGLN